MVTQNDLRLYTMQDLSRIFSISLRTVRAWSAAGKLDFCRVELPARMNRYDPTKIEEAIRIGRFACGER
jgi:hypothetical protein